MDRKLIFTLAVSLLALRVYSFSDELSGNQKGTIGEQLVKEAWEKTGRQSVLNHRFGNPNIHGPDHVFLTQSGEVEIHETKALNRFASLPDLQTTSNGKECAELSDQWIKDWMNNPKSNYHELSEDVQNKIISGKYTRRLNSINTETTEMRVFKIEASGVSKVAIGDEVAGAFRLSRSRIKELSQSAKAMSQASKICTGDNSLLCRGKITSVGSNADPLKTLKNARSGGSRNGFIFGRGVLLSDGRLIVAASQGANAGLFTFVYDAGIAEYQFVSGGIDKSTLNEKLNEAALKGVIVNGAVGIAVLFNPATGVVAAVAIGSYIITDFAIEKWKAYHERPLLTLKDLQDIAIPIDPNISLNVENWFDHSNP